ncbi:MAG TPA: asparagine--tRNA ligase [Rectinemataceae bacterium]|nr:asparagine--tRNA ligase [Rectinemataceae bacterium]
MKRLTLKEIDGLEASGQILVARGWVRTRRESKNVVFLELNDGSRLGNLQCVFDSPSTSVAEVLAKAGTGAAVSVEGSLVPSPAAGQKVELKATKLELVGEAPEDFPVQKKGTNMETLRAIAHLRPRTNTFGAVARVRNAMARGVHRFFQDRGFYWIHTPIITASDAEGAGAMFQVTTLDLDRIAKTGGPVDYSKDFFGKPAFLTVSGQLNVETYAQALGRAYTFGPTFRAENSNTTRHLSEFWMIEPEVAWNDIDDNMDLAEDFVRFLVKTALEDCAEDLEFFDKRIQNGLVEYLAGIASKPFERMTYTEAVARLEKNAGDFEFKPYWGCDLQSEHEKWLTEKVVGGPLIVTDYPKDIKAFYMKQNDDGKTVAAMDVLVPRFGEIIGGSEREWRLGLLEKRILDLGLKPETYSWYLDLRRYGSTPHAGFGLGFERLILFITGMQNIRDVIPFPRAPKLADF